MLQRFGGSSRRFVRVTQQAAQHCTNTATQSEIHGTSSIIKVKTVFYILFLSFIKLKMGPGPQRGYIRARPWPPARKATAPGRVPSRRQGPAMSLGSIRVAINLGGRGKKPAAAKR